MEIIPVILSGGFGTRLWPLSRKQNPKQYLPLISDNTMLQETILRLSTFDNIADPIILCNVDHRFLVAEQCQQINIKNPTILLEPVSRNTAPAITAAALYLIKKSNDAMLLVLSADHVIQDVEEFHKAISIGSKQAQEGKLTTFGIVPTNANTGYGYIKSSKENNGGAYKVEEFVEKPDRITAKKYLHQGDFLWNSGIFMFKVNTLIDKLTVHSPDIVKLVSDAVNKATHDLDFIRLDRQIFETSPSVSIDYALMEKSDSVVVVHLDAGWGDVGSWSALYNISEQDSNGNIFKGDVTAKDTTNSYIYASNHVVASVGVDNLIVIHTSDATFIASQDKAHEVKTIVSSLEKKGIDEAHSNRKVFRPWGWYDSIEKGENFQVKKLYVKPGGKLSLQMHHKRAEHWVVVRGIATVTKGDQTFTLEKGHSTYIPLGVTHGLGNTTNKPLEIIEVQSGTYLGEDDIVRFEDIYGRIKEN